MSVTINGTSGVVFNDASSQNTSAFTGGFAMRNRIINGAMVIDQRNAGAATANTINGYTVDRWVVGQTTTGKLIAQQNAGSLSAANRPAGFTNYLGVTSQSAYTVGTSDVYWIQQWVEGFNFADLAWGTSSAATVTLSFWVRSSLTGTFGGTLKNDAGNRSYPFTYTISSANTWEQKTVTIAGDTSGTWLTTNGAGVGLQFGLGAGSTYSGTAGAWAAGNFFSATGATSVVGTNGATFYITGVQLEKGSTATSFDRRDYGRELMMCQRYFFNTGGDNVYQQFAVGQAYSASQVNGLIVPFPAVMRAVPTFSISDLSHFVLQNSSGSGGVVSALSQDATEASSKFGAIRATRSASGLTGGNAAVLGANNTTAARLNWSSEL